MAGENDLKYDVDLSKAPNCPHVRICLNVPAKASNYEEPSFSDLDVFQSLQKRQQNLDKRLSNKRMMQKANAISQMRQVPEINSYSKKIMECKTPDTVSKFKHDQAIRLKKKTKKNPDKIKQKKKKIKPDSILSNPMSPDIFKHTKSLEITGLSFSSPASQKPVIARLKEWDEQREKRLTEKQKQKEIEDMLECTFTPQLSFRLDLTQTSVQTEGFSLRPISPQTHYITEVKPISCEYSQISPVVFKVGYRQGYNREEFLSRALPMARYEVSDSDSDSL